MRPRYDTHRPLHALWSPVGHPDKPTVAEFYQPQLLRFEWDAAAGMESWGPSELRLMDYALKSLRKEARD